MICVCGHFHGGTCRCGCTVYEPDDGSDGVDDDSCLGANSIPTATTERINHG